MHIKIITYEKEFQNIPMKVSTALTIIKFLYSTFRISKILSNRIYSQFKNLIYLIPYITSSNIIFIK